MGSSALQSILVGIVYGFIFDRINRKQYWVVTNEAGLHIDKKSNLANDIAIFEKEGIIPTNQYFSVPQKSSSK